MRTTVTLDPEVAAAVERLKRERGTGVSGALNELARRGLAAAEKERKPFVQTTSDLGLKVDVRNIGEVLEELDREELHKHDLGGDPE